MIDHTPRVSIGLPVYNGEKYLASAFDSLLAQTFVDFELIISDNASTDHTTEICREYAASDSRIRYYREEVNQGAPWNFNRVFQYARGEFFKWQAADDVVAPTLLERSVAMLEADPSAVLCYPRTTVIDAQGDLLSDAPGSWRPPESNNGYTASEQADPRGLNSLQPAERLRGILMDTVWCYELFGLTRRDVMRRTHLHRNSSASGKCFLIEMAFQGRLVEIPEVLFFNRRHAQQYTMLTNVADQQSFDRPGKKQRSWPWPYHLRCTAMYAGCIWRAPISFSQRLQCSAVLLRYIFQVSKWKRVIQSAWRGRGMWDGSLAAPASPIQNQNAQKSAHAVMGLGTQQRTM
jgi:glycosyltransferase involved in cell wall biosynthesis